MSQAQVLVSRVGSTGRCNTIETVDPTVFPRETELFGSTRSKPSQDCVPGDLTWRALLAVVFNAMRARAECCVDPLKPPGKSDNWRLVPTSNQRMESANHEFRWLAKRAALEAIARPCEVAVFEAGVAQNWAHASTVGKTAVPN